MGHCCYSFCPSSSHLLATDFSQRMKSLKLSYQKGWPAVFRRASKVYAYHGFKTPPYKLDALEPYMSQKTLEMHWGGHHRNYVEGLNKQLGNDDILYGYTLDELVKVTYNNGNPLPEFNNAAQVWNHDFFWESMQPGGGDMPQLGLLEQIEKDFGSFRDFKEKFIEAALALFGSGWVWLVWNMKVDVSKLSAQCCPFWFATTELYYPRLEQVDRILFFTASYPPVKGEDFSGFSGGPHVKRKEKRLEITKTSNAVTPIVWDDIPIISLDMWEHAYYIDYKNDKGKYVNVFMDHLVSWNMAMARMDHAQAFVNLSQPKIPIA